MNLLTDVDARPVIGHRGMAAAAPENTLEAMELGFACGADAVEFDLRVSSDGVVVVFHDSTVNRTTEGEGLVGEMTFAGLRALNAGARFVPGAVEDRVPPPVHGKDGSVYPEYQSGGAGKSRKYSIPAFEEVLERFPHKHLLIEIKDPTAAPGARRLIEKFNAQGRCMIDSYDASALRVFHGSGIPVGPGKAGLIQLLKSFFLFRGSGIKYDGMCVPPRFRNFPLPLRILSRIARRDRKTMHVWTVNTPSEAGELWRLGANGIITDDVRPILESRPENAR